MINRAPQEWFPRLVSQLDRGFPQVLITVVQAQGSVPRDPGARMWVGTSMTVDTIGGGHLEWQAIAYARELLAAQVHSRTVVRYALGPSLGQCCGGVVWLAFEYLDQSDLGWCRSLEQALLETRPVQRRIALTVAGQANDQPVSMSEALAGAVNAWDPNEHHFLDVWGVPLAHIVVCGAGHVGHAIVAILATLPVQVSWLDPRDDCWPDEIPQNVRRIQGDADDVLDLPDDACWLVLTHSHALDLALVEAVFQHRKFHFLGLIGSKTKKARFVSRLQRRFPDELVARMQCPIGLVATSSKEPAVIAVSVVAQLLRITGA